MKISVEVLRSTPLFSGLRDEDYCELARLGVRETFKDDTIIITEGEPGETLYIIEKGAVRVEKGTIEKQQEILASLDEGACFGEMSLIDSEPRSASVRTTEDVTVIAFSRGELDRLFATHPDAQRILLANLVRILALRLRRVNESLIQNIYDSIIVVDRDYKILRWSKSTERDYFIDAKTAINRNIFVLLPELLEEGLDRKMKQVMETGETAYVETEYQAEGGMKVYMESTLAPYREGKVIKGVVIVNRNITKLKHLEQELVKSERLAAVGEMAYEVGHELNNYLSVILGHTYMLSVCLENKLYDRMKRSTQIITEQVEKMERFTSGLLESSRQELEKSECDINELILKSIDFVRFWNRFRGIAFVTHLDDRLPPVYVDSNQLQQVLVNLYSNAANVMPGSAERRRITTTTTYNETEGFVEIAVSDTGPGIPEDIRGRVFEPGFTTRKGGHGFGLAICYRIIKNHHGTIDVESAPGAGATFHIRLPLHQQ
jgi:two-component system, sporulation sensor kinase E